MNGIMREKVLHIYIYIYIVGKSEVMIIIFLITLKYTFPSVKILESASLKLNAF